MTKAQEAAKIPIGKNKTPLVEVLRAVLKVNPPKKKTAKRARTKKANSQK